MIYFLTLLCSLCIQFGAVDFPIDIISQNAAHETFAQTVVSNFNSTYNKSIDYKYVIITRRNNNTYPFYLWIPIELYDSNITSSISCTARTDEYCSITNVGWIRYQVMSNATVPTSTSPNTTSSIGILYYSDSVVNNGLIFNKYYTLPYNQVDTFITSIDDVVPILPCINGIGSLGSGGHSSGNSPFEELENNPISWGHSSSVPSPNGHSVSLPTTQPTFDFSNGLQYLLGQIVDNTNTIISSISSVFSGLSIINNNIISGFSAVFNAISGFNENFLSYIDYIFTPFDSAAFVEDLDNSSFGLIFDLADEFSDSFNGNYTDDEHCYIVLDLRNVTYFSSFGRQVFDLDDYLGSSKTTWQPLLIIFLYASVLWGAFKSIPAMLSGVSPISDYFRREP